MKTCLSRKILIFFLFSLLTQSCGKGLIDLGSIIQDSPTTSNPTQSQTISSASSLGKIELFAQNLVAPINIPTLPHVATFGSLGGLTLDSSGNIYVADSSNNLIRKIDLSGNVSTFAGTGVAGATDGYRTAALFNTPQALVFDSGGNMYVTDYGNYIIRKIDTSGMVTTLAGLSNSPGSADGNGAAARFASPFDISFDPSTNMLYVSDLSNHNIRQIDPFGNVTTFAGSTVGNQGSVDATGTAALFYGPLGLTISYGYLYVADIVDNTIRQIDLSNRNVVTFAGTSLTSGSNNGAALGVATFQQPGGVAADSAGNIYVIDQSTIIRQIATSGTVAPITATVVSTVAGTVGGGYNDGPGASALFSGLSGCSYGTDGNLYVTEASNYTVRKITPTWVVSTVAGVGGLSGSEDNIGPRSLIPSFAAPVGIGIDPAGNIYIGDTRNFLLRKLSAAGEVTTLAGTKGLSNFVDGAGSAARFTDIEGILVSSTGDIYLADYLNNAIRKVTSSGVVSTFASGVFQGPISLTEDSAHNIYVADYANHIIQKIDTLGNVNPFAGALGVQGSMDGDKDTQATFNLPSGVAFDSNGDLYVVESGNNLIRKITIATGQVSTFAGLGPVTFSNPTGLVIDKFNNLYLCDSGNNVIRKIDSAGNVSTFAGALGMVGTDDGVGTDARFLAPRSLTIDLAGNIYVSDSGNDTIRKITSEGLVSTLAGTPGVPGSTDSIASASQILVQGSLTKGLDGSFYIADTFNQVIRKTTADGTVSILAGSGAEGHADGNGALASFKFPQGITMNKNGNLYVSDTFNHTIRQITPSGVVSTFAGTVTLNGLADGIGTAAQFNYPQGITSDSLGNLYVADTANTAIRKITPGGTVTTFVGNSLNPGGYVDGLPANARFGFLKNISIDPAGNIYAIDIANSAIRKITSFLGIAQNVETLASQFILSNSSSPSAYNATLLGAGIGIDSDDNIYVLDSVNSLVHKINSKGVDSIVAGIPGKAAFDLGSLPRSLDHPSSIFVDSSGPNVALYVLENNTIVKITL